MKCCSAGGRAIAVPCQVLRDSRVLFPALPLIICVIAKISAHLKRGEKYSLLLVSGSCRVFWFSATAGVQKLRYCPVLLLRWSRQSLRKWGWKHLCVCETCLSSRLKLSPVRVGWPQSASSFLQVFCLQNSKNLRGWEVTGALCQLSRGGDGYSCLLTSPGYFTERCGIALWNRLGRLTVSTDNELFLSLLSSCTGGRVLIQDSLCSR